MRKFTVCFWLAALLLLPSKAFGDQVVTDPKNIGRDSQFGRYLRSQEFITSLYKAGVAWDRKRDALCADGKHNVAFLAVSEIVQPVAMQTSHPVPVAGLWVTRFRMERCNRTMFYTVALVAQNGREAMVTPLVPGETAANLALLADLTKPLMLVGITLVDQSCRDAIKSSPTTVAGNVIDTSAPVMLNKDVPGFKGAVGNHSQERWWLKFCNSVVAVDVEFFPNPQMPGISYKLTPVKNPPTYAPR